MILRASKLSINRGPSARLRTIMTQCGRKCMNAASDRIRWFKDIRLEDVPLVGGKTASLGELYSALAPQGVRVPNGFALTASAYRDALTQAGAWENRRSLLADLDSRRMANLAKRARAARAIV